VIRLVSCAATHFLKFATGLGGYPENSTGIRAHGNAYERAWSGGGSIGCVTLESKFCFVWAVDQSNLLRLWSVRAVDKHVRLLSLGTGQARNAIARPRMVQKLGRTMACGLRPRVRMGGVEAVTGMRMQDAGRRNPSVDQWGETLPSNLRALTSTYQSTSPASANAKITGTGERCESAKGM